MGSDGLYRSVRDNTDAKVQSESELISEWKLALLEWSHKQA